MEFGDKKTPRPAASQTKLSREKRMLSKNHRKMSSWEWSLLREVSFGVTIPYNQKEGKAIVVIGKCSSFSIVFFFAKTLLERSFALPFFYLSIFLALKMVTFSGGWFFQACHRREALLLSGGFSCLSAFYFNSEAVLLFLPRWWFFHPSFNLLRSAVTFYGSVSMRLFSGRLFSNQALFGLDDGDFLARRWLILECVFFLARPWPSPVRHRFSFTWLSAEFSQIRGWVYYAWG